MRYVVKVMITSFKPPATTRLQGFPKESHGLGVVPPAWWSYHWSLDVTKSSIPYFLKPSHVDQTLNDKYVLTTKNTL
jgi:hypothetical protein